MVDNGAEVDAKDRSGFTALHYATAAKDKERVSYLLQSGANPNVQNNSGSTALHLTSDPEIAGLLLASSVEVDLSDIHGNTPLHVAVRGRHKELVRMLLEKKADMSKANANNKTPLNLAKDKEMRLILQGKALDRGMTPSPTPSNSNSASGCKRKKAASNNLDELMASIAPKCLSPGILKKRKLTSPSDEDPDSNPDSSNRKGPRLRFSDVNDYSGVEEVEEQQRRVRVTPIYSEPTFSSDEDEANENDEDEH